MNQVTSDEARRNFRDLLNDVEHGGEHVTVLRYKTPSVVVVPAEWYKRAQAAMARETFPEYVRSLDAH